MLSYLRQIKVSPPLDIWLQVSWECLKCHRRNMEKKEKRDFHLHPQNFISFLFSSLWQSWRASPNQPCMSTSMPISKSGLHHMKGKRKERNFKIANPSFSRTSNSGVLPFSLMISTFQCSEIILIQNFLAAFMKKEVWCVLSSHIWPPNLSL